jgi:prepilin-type N-terminal cleavage/methylation domain-containing protein
MLRMKKTQRGDTIVEVLIAIAVVSLVLVAAYVTTSRNINGLQDTQEHSEALQLAQTQLELLHNSSTQPSGSKQCFLQTTGALTANVNNCMVDSNGCVLGASGCPPTSTIPAFNLNVTKISSGPTTSTYSVDVQWASAIGGQTNSVQLFYQP